MAHGGVEGVVSGRGGEMDKVGIVDEGLPEERVGVGTWCSVRWWGRQVIR